MTIILAILISTLSLAAGFHAPHGQCNLDGLCQGSIIKEVSFDFETIVEGKVACINFCRKTPGCFWYSLDRNSGMCTALEDCPTLEINNQSHIISGNKDCSKYTCKEYGLCQGTLIEVYPYADDYKTCLDHCQDNPECLWFTYFPQGKACVLLASDCSDTLLPCSDCLSGQRQCKEISPTRNKLMISGFDTLIGIDNFSGFELIDLSNSSKQNCPLPDYPLSANYYDITDMDGTLPH